MSRSGDGLVDIRASVETLRSRSVGSLGVGLFAVLGLTACSLDDRQLSVGRTDAGDAGDGGDAADAALLGDADASSTKPPSESGAPGTQDDSGRVSNEASGPGGNTGGCVHTGADGAPDCADTLASNADFNRNVVGWASGDPGNAKWDPADSQGAKTSGSIAVTNKIEVDIDGFAVSAATQCIPVTPGAVYTFSAEVFIPSGQTYGLGQIAVWFYPAPACKGNDDQAYTVVNADVTNRWTTINGSLIAPSADQSMSVQLQAQKPFRATPFVAKFDAIRVEKQ